MNTNEQPNLTGDENGNVFVASGIQSEPIGAEPTRWAFLTSAKAWQLAERSGQAAPYAGYMIELKDGRKLRCRHDTHKTVFEVSLSNTRTIHSTPTN